MPFYFLAVKPWLHDMKKVACIEIAGNRKGGKIMDLSDVKSVNDLMNKKAMPIRNISIKYAKDIDEEDTNVIRGGEATKEEVPIGPKDETLGETLKRLEKEKKAKKHAAAPYKRSQTLPSPSSPKGSLVSSARRRILRSRTPEKRSRRASDTSAVLASSYSPAPNETLRETLKRIKKDRKIRNRRSSSTVRTTATDAKDKLEGKQERRSSMSSVMTDSSQLSSVELEHSEIVHIPDAPLQARTKAVQDEDALSKADTDFSDADTLSQGDHLSLLAETDNEDEFEESEHAVEEEEAMSSGHQEASDQTPGHLYTPEEALPNAMIASSSQASVGNDSNAERKLCTSRLSNVTDATMEESLSDSFRIEEDEPKPSKLKSSMKVATLQESLRSAAVELARTTSNDSAPSLPARRRSLSHSAGKEFSSSAESTIADDLEEIFCRGCALMKQPHLATRLEWGKIQVREYDVCLGDNPACASGAPIQLDWKYKATKVSWIEEGHYPPPPHPKRLSSRCRRRMLLSLGYTQDQLREATRVKAQDQKNRIKTVSRLQYMNFDYNVEKIVRIFPSSA